MTRDCLPQMRSSLLVDASSELQLPFSGFRSSSTLLCGGIQPLPYLPTVSNMEQIDGLYRCDAVL
jgi:hypothetical protein